MAKEVKVVRDVAADLLGDTKPAKGIVPDKKAKALPAAAQGSKAKAEKIETARVAANKKLAGKPVSPGRKSKFTDGMKIKIVGERDVRDGGNVAKAVELIKKNPTVGQYVSAMGKARNPLPPTGLLAYLQRSGYVRVS